MKICITFKTPDAIEYALEEALPNEKPNYETDSWEPLSEDEQDVREGKLEEVKKFLQCYIKHGEVVTLEFDTDAKTATVFNVK